MSKHWAKLFEPVKRLSHVFFIFLAVVQSVAAQCGPVERISRKDIKPLKNGMPGEEGFDKEIVFAAGIKIAATINVTNKGNGSLQIANLKLKIFDSHDDGKYYENEMLKIEFVDLDGDGKRELLVSGIVCFTDEKGDSMLRREAVVFIYALQLNHTFRLIYSNTDLRLDLSPVTSKKNTHPSQHGD
jgi:hypothetical protein